MTDQPTYRRILAVDTATRVQSVALLDGDTVLEHSQRRVKFNHGSTLLEHLSQTFDEQMVGIDDLDLIAVGVGPGSFTGLRVGLAIAKSLARSEEIPIVGISTLAALAYPIARANPDAQICPMYDARRREIYTGVYRWRDGQLAELQADHTAAPPAYRERLIDRAGSAQQLIVVGDAPRKYDELSGWDTDAIHVLPTWADAPPATAVALLGRHKALTAGPDDLRSLEPNYIRPTDAEIALKKRSG